MILSSPATSGVPAITVTTTPFRSTQPGRAEQSIPDPDVWAYAAARLDAIRAELA